jgi:hypothetical protein
MWQVGYDRKPLPVYELEDSLYGCGVSGAQQHGRARRVDPAESTARMLGLTVPFARPAIRTVKEVRAPVLQGCELGGNRLGSTSLRAIAE